MYRLSYYSQDSYVRIQNPTLDALTEIIRSLKEKDQTSLLLEKSSTEHISVIRCKRQRYSVRYVHYDEYGKPLEQKEFTDAGCLDKNTQVPYFEADGMKYYVPLFQTITLDDTIRALCYFLEHGTLPQELSD